MKGNNKTKYIYFLFTCIFFSFFIIGATLAYFAAESRDDNTVVGSSSAVSLSLYVDKVTTVDMAFGMIPMLDNLAPYAANSMCKDLQNNPVCQIYKITIQTDSDEIFFLDGYISITKKEGVDTSFSRVYPVYGESNSNIDYFKVVDDFSVEKDVKTGDRVSNDDIFLNNNDDNNCLFITNDGIGGDGNKTKTYYAMIWLHDTGESQDDIQGLERAYSGSVSVVTAQGNEIKATFD